MLNKCGKFCVKVFLHYIFYHDFCVGIFYFASPYIPRCVTLYFHRSYLRYDCHADKLLLILLIIISKLYASPSWFGCRPINAEQFNGSCTSLRSRLHCRLKVVLQLFSVVCPSCIVVRNCVQISSSSIRRY